MMQKFFFTFLLLGSATVFADCSPAVKIFGSLNLVKKSWKLINSAPRPTSICMSVDARNPNLELVFKKGKLEYHQTIFSSLDGYYDYQNEKKKLSGGTYLEKNIFIEAWAPSWYKGSQFRVQDIETGKTLLETKL